MIGRILLAGCMVAAATSAGAAYVGTSPVAPASGYEQIRAGRMNRAESLLTEQMGRHPDAPEVALNLAAVYARTGRPQLAEPLYRRVLELPAMSMDMPSGSVVSSHSVALAGRALIATRIAAH